MDEKLHKIRRAFLVPLILIVVLLFSLLLVGLFKNSGKWEIIVVSVLFFVSLVACVDMIKREIITNDQGVKVKKVFRSKELAWPEITHFAVVVLKKKVYFLLTTTKGFYIFSNLFENHALLVQSIVEKLDKEKVETEVKAYLDHPVERLAMIVMSWIATVIIIGAIILKISGI
jgi:hypothetical protein